MGTSLDTQAAYIGSKARRLSGALVGIECSSLSPRLSPASFKGCGLQALWSARSR